MFAIYGEIKVMFQTTNQITIIFPLLLVSSLWKPLFTITINHHIPTYVIQLYMYIYIYISVHGFPIINHGFPIIKQCIYIYIPSGYQTSPWKSPFLIGKPSTNGPSIPWLCSITWGYIYIYIHLKSPEGIPWSQVFWASRLQGMDEHVTWQPQRCRSLTGHFQGPDSALENSIFRSI